jgi:hypothetical protein
VRTHLGRFLAETAAATDGAGVRFIEREFRAFLGCGQLEGRWKLKLAVRGGESVYARYDHDDLHVAFSGPIAGPPDFENQ